MDTRSERDIWLGMFERRKRELMREGVSEREADERASEEIRRLIRNS